MVRPKKLKCYRTVSLVQNNVTAAANNRTTDTGSSDFDEFLNFMGETIDLKDWEKYAGGLDTKSKSSSLVIE
jgi:hypothetical protein